MKNTKILFLFAILFPLCLGVKAQFNILQVSSDVIIENIEDTDIKEVYKHLQSLYKNADSKFNNSQILWFYRRHYEVVLAVADINEDSLSVSYDYYNELIGRKWINKEIFAISSEEYYIFSQSLSNTKVGLYKEIKHSSLNESFVMLKITNGGISSGYFGFGITPPTLSQETYNDISNLPDDYKNIFSLYNLIKFFYNNQEIR